MAVEAAAAATGRCVLMLLSWGSPKIKFLLFVVCACTGNAGPG
jgi:hypothetical protein